MLGRYNVCILCDNEAARRDEMIASGAYRHIYSIEDIEQTIYKLKISEAFTISNGGEFEDYIVQLVKRGVINES
jgi:hypothetical protein